MTDLITRLFKKILTCEYDNKRDELIYMRSCAYEGLSFLDPANENDYHDQLIERTKGYECNVLEKENFNGRIY